ncbi:MAG: N-acetylmuramoyl-L-alanine amidase [Flavobacterium sp.]
MKTKIKVLGILSTALLCGLFAFRPAEEKKVILIDAGHGGHDFGVTMYGFQEKNISETIAQKIKALNKDNNIEIVLLREGDHFMELSERVSIINNLKPDLVISLHVNSSKSFESNGVDAYISSKKEFYEKSKENAEKIVNKISGENLSKRRVTEAPFYILKNANCAAITLEMGFLSNNNDRVYLTSESGQNEIAANILESIKE